MTTKRPVAALRVAQLDTVELDSSAIRLLSTQLQACFKHKLNGYDLMQVEPHLRAVMYVLFLYSTLWKNGQTIGQKLLRLRYASDNFFLKCWEGGRCPSVALFLTSSLHWVSRTEKR